MKKLKKAISILLTFALVIGVLVLAAVRLDYEAKPTVLNFLGLNPTIAWKGKLPPSFALTELHTKKQIALSSFRGKVVVLDFWASWCHGCRKQLPILQKLYKDPAFSKKAQILTINMKEVSPPSVIKQFLRQHQYTFPVLLGTETIVKAYKIWFFPTLVVLKPNGKVFYTGAEPHTEQKIRKLIQQASKP